MKREKLTYNDILIRPILTEKTHREMAQEKPKYTFEVSKLANKPMIREAVEKLFNVKVEKVNVINVKPKPKRRYSVRFGKTRSWKKAIVTLKEGYRISELDAH